MALWFVVLILVLSIRTGVVRCQTDTLGFISIDCGLSSNSTTQDNITGLTYVSDDQFIDTGVNYIVSSQYTSYLRDTLLTVRSFPKGKKNCYTLRSLNPGSRYLVRVACMYGNYDKLNKPPTFDLYLGVNYWKTVTIYDADSLWFTEIISVATADYMQVCLVRGSGNPFISWLDLRPLKESIYQYANSSQSLVYFKRFNLGASETLRYPADSYDRIWVKYPEDMKNISTTTTMKTDKEFETPSLVLQTAAVSFIFTFPLNISWISDDQTDKYYVILHIAEVENMSLGNLREFTISRDGLVDSVPITPTPLAISYSYTDENNLNYNVSLQGTSKSNQPPLLNAIEMHIVRPVTEVPTDGGDVTAINAIKANYKVDKEWNGDPCVPTNLTWTGVNCTTDSSRIYRITGLIISSSGLTGPMISEFGNLTMLKKLDLSWNKLTGSMPSSLDQLTSLTLLDISGNNLTLSPGLQKKQQSGALTVINSNSPPASNKKKIIIAIAVVVLLALIGGIVTGFLCLTKSGNYSVLEKKNNSISENIHHFNYKELKVITNNFETNIGTGGFGSVYLGLYKNKQVAVKKHSDSSSQGKKEFLAEVKHLTRVHSKHLVSLIGYCMNKKCMALVYEYMQGGTLKNKLRGNVVVPLTWKQRVQIAYESAQGLNYLHNSCVPPIIHRDVKTDNILLNSNLEAKIADFGTSREFDISRKFDNDAASEGVTLAGTAGYFDPDAQNSEKSDVFSFGVVMLEIITGKPPILQEGDNLRQWVDQKIENGDRESIVDERMQAPFDINSIFNVTELAQNCTEQSTHRRPTMDTVVAKLKEIFEQEISSEKIQSIV